MSFSKSQIAPPHSSTNSPSLLKTQSMRTVWEFHYICGCVVERQLLFTTVLQRAKYLCGLHKPNAFGELERVLESGKAGINNTLDMQLYEAIQSFEMGRAPLFQSTPPPPINTQLLQDLAEFHNNL